MNCFPGIGWFYQEYGGDDSHHHSYVQVELKADHGKLYGPAFDSCCYHYFQETAWKVWQRIRTKLAEINAFLAEHIAGMGIIQAFNMQNRKAQEFDKVNKEYFEAHMKSVKVFGIFRPFMDVVETLGMALLLWYGGRSILAGVLEFGTLYMFVDYLGRFYWPIRELTEQFNTLQNSIVSAERVFNLLDQEVEPRIGEPFPTTITWWARSNLRMYGLPI